MLKVSFWLATIISQLCVCVQVVSSNTKVCVYVHDSQTMKTKNS